MRLLRPWILRRKNMAYPFDEDDGTATAEDSGEQQRKFMNLLFTLPRKPVLGNRGTNQDLVARAGGMDEAEPTRDTSVSAMNPPRPNIPRSEERRVGKEGR